MAKFDDIKDKGRFQSIGSDLLKKHTHHVEGLYQQERRIADKMSHVQAEINDLVVKGAGVVAENANRLENLVKTLERQRTALADLEKERRQGAAKVFTSDVRKLGTSDYVRKEILGAQRSASMSEAIDIAKRMSAGEISAASNAALRQVSEHSGRMEQFSRNIGGNEPQFIYESELRDKAIRGAALLKSAARAQKKLGLDPEERYYSAHEYIQKSSREEAAMQIRRDVQAGRISNPAEIEKQKGEAKQKLDDIWKQWEAMTDKTSKAARDLSDSFHETKEEIEKYKIAMSEMGKMGGGGGGLHGMMSLMGNMGTLAVAGSQIYRNVGITSELQVMQNQTGFARAQNERFMDVFNASRGDARSLRRLMSGTAGQAAKFGALMGGRESNAMFFEAAGQSGRAIGDFADSIESVKSFGATLKGILGGSVAGPGGALLGSSNAVLRSLGDAAPSTIAATSSITDFMKNISRGQTALNAEAAYNARDTEIHRIDDMMLDRAMQFKSGVGMSTRGLGGRRRGIAGGLLNPLNRRSLAGVGLTDEEIPGLISEGRDALGAAFGGFRDVRAAGQMAQAGYLNTPGQYFQAAGSLAGAGGNVSQNLENILKNAVANGMDSSKNLMQMVQGITSISDRSASAGIDVLSQSTTSMGRTVDALRDIGVNPNLAARAAAGGIGVAQEWSRDTGLNMFSVIKTAELNTRYPTLSHIQRARMSQLTPQETERLVQAYQSGNKENIAKAKAELGVTGIESLEEAKSLRDIKVRDIDRRTGGVFQNERYQAAMRKMRERGEKSLSMEERAIIQEAGFVQTQGQTGGLAITGGLGGAPRSSVPSYSISDEEKQRMAQSEMDAKMFSDAVSKFQETGNKFSEVGEIMRQLIGKRDPREFAEATKRAADEQMFTKGAQDFNMVPFQTGLQDATDALKSFKKMLEEVARFQGSLKYNTRGR